MHRTTLIERKSSFRIVLSWAICIALVTTPVAPWPSARAEQSESPATTSEPAPKTRPSVLRKASSPEFGDQGVCRPGSHPDDLGATRHDLPVVQPTRPGDWRGDLKHSEPLSWSPGARAGQSIAPGPVPPELNTAGRWLPGYRPSTERARRQFAEWQETQKQRGTIGALAPRAPAGSPAANLLKGGDTGQTADDHEITHYVHSETYHGTPVDLREIDVTAESPRPHRESDGYHHHSGLTWEEYSRVKEEAQSNPGSPDMQVGEGPSLIDAPGIFMSSFDAIQSNLTTVPPDPIMTAGPNHLVAVVNSRYRVYDKSGNPLTPTITTDSLLGASPNCFGTFDVFVDWDAEEDRFILGAETINGQGESYLCIAVSDTSDPTTTWTTFSFRSDTALTSAFMDYPHAGIGFDAVYIGANMFDDGGAGFQEARLYALDKTSLYNGGPLQVAEAGLGAGVFAPQPAKIRGFTSGGWPPVNEPHYIIATTFGTTRVYTWEDPINQTVVLDGTVDDFFNGAPPNAPELDDTSTDMYNDTAGGAWMDAEYRDGSVWASRTVGCNAGGGGSESCVDWIEIDVSGGSPTLAQQQTGGAYGSADEFRYYTDGAVDKDNNFAVGYTHSSLSDYTSARVTGREFGDPAGELQASEEVQRQGLGNYTDGGGCNGACDRWGDYTGMAIDPDGCTFWYLGQYSDGGSGLWGTNIGSYRFPGCSVDSGIEIEKGTYTCSETFTVEVDDSIRVSAASVSANTAITTGSDSETIPASAWIGTDCVGSDCSSWAAALPTSSSAGANDDGVLNVTDGDNINIVYSDPHGGHGSPVRNAAVSCETRFDDGGFLIFGGCEGRTGPELYNQYLDAGELIDYEFGMFYPSTAPSLTDVTASLDITGPASAFLTVLNPTVHVGAVEPGVLTSAVFQIQVDPAVDAGGLRLTLHDFDLSITSPADGYDTPQVLNQQQYVQADDNIVTVEECFNFESGDQGWVRDNYVGDYTCSPPDCPAPRAITTVAAPWTRGGGCGTETRTDHPSCAANGSNAFMANSTAGSCNNFAQSNNNLTDDIIFSPILTPPNTGNAGNGEPWMFQLVAAEWFYNSDMEAGAEVAAAWGHYWSTDYQGVSTPAQNEVDTLYDFFLGFFFYPDQAWDSGTAWDPQNPPANYDGVAFPSTAGGEALPGTQFRWAIEMFDADFGGDPTATAATTGVVYDDVNLIYDQYHREEQIGVCAAGAAEATVTFGQLAYQSCPGTLDISVLDGDGVGPLSVTVTSTAGDSETVSLSGSGPNFTAALDFSTAGGAAADDGTLLVTPSDTVTVTYTEASPAGDRTNIAAISCPGGNVTVAGVTGLQDNGDGDGFADKFETVDITIALQNDTGADLTNVMAYIFTDDPDIDCITKNVASFGTIAEGTSTSNDLGSDPFTFKVAAGADCTDPASPPTASFDVFITADGLAGASSLQSLTLSLDLDESGSTITFSENFDAGPGGFTHEVGPGDDDGVDGVIGAAGVQCGGYGDEFFHSVSGGNPGGGFFAWNNPADSFPNGTYSDMLDSVLLSPEFTIDAASTTVSFDVEYKFADSGPAPGGLRADGARVDYRVNGGAWQKLGGLAYDGPLIFNTYCNPLCNGGDDLSGASPPSTRDCFHETANNGEDIYNVLGDGVQNWTGDSAAIASLTPGDKVQVRFRVGTMNASVFTLDQTGGFGVDNFSITNVKEVICDANPSPPPDTGCNVVFYDADNLTEVCGDGDLNIEPTEIWDVDVTLQKLGAGDAVNTVADLALNAGSAVSTTISGNPGAYGTIAGNGGMSTQTYQFEVDSGAPCLENATFDIENISDNAESYPNNLSVFNVGVGSVASSETGNQQLNPASATSSTASASFTPVLGLATPVDHATVSFSGSYGGGATEVATQDSALDNIQNGSSDSTLSPAFTITGGTATSATVDWTSLTTQGTSDLTACVRVSLITPNATEIILKDRNVAAAPPYDVLLDYQGGNGGPGQYSIRLDERQGGGCNGNASLSGTTMTVSSTPAGNFTTSARVSLHDGTTSHILKDFNVAAASSYDVTSIYNAAGPGTYSIEIEENGGGGTAEVSAAKISLETGACDLGCLAGPAPPPVADGIDGTGIIVNKGVGPDDLVIDYDVATCSSDHAVVLYGDFGNFTGFQGAVATGCDAGSSGTANITQAGSFWFILQWVDSGDAAGSPGDATSGQRSWSATGLCGVTSDNPTDPVCN